MRQPVSIIKRELSFAEVIQQLEKHYSRLAADRIQEATSMRVAVACANAGKEGDGLFEDYRRKLAKPDFDIFGRSMGAKQPALEDLVEGDVSVLRG